MGLGGVCTMHLGVFDLEHVKVIWGHSGHFSKKRGHNSKMAHHRPKRTKIWVSGGVCSMHVDFFDLEHVKTICGHLVHFSDKKGRNSS